MSTRKGIIPMSVEKVESGRVQKKGNPGEYREGKIRVSTENGKILVITGKGRIRESTGNGGSGRVPKMWYPGEYRKCGIRASIGKVKSG